MLHYFFKYGGINMFDWDKVRELAQKAGAAALEKGKEKLETVREMQGYSDKELIETSKKSSTSGTDKFIIKAELRKRYSNYDDDELFSIGKTSKYAIEREVASMILKERGY